MAQTRTRASAAACRRISHAASVALHGVGARAVRAGRARLVRVVRARVRAGALAAVLANGRARFESGAMHVPLAFATRELLRFATNVAAANR